MTIKITKLRLGAAMLALAMLVPATAWATHVFSDVVDGAFYASSTEWAKTNNITTGSPAGSSTFKPLDGVTRGESVTFLKRYDDNIVQPALTTLTGTAAANSAAIVGNDVDIAANTAGIASAPTVYTAQVNNDCTALNQSGGLVFTIRPSFDYICDVVFPTDISACTWNITPALFGADIGWALVGLTYAIQPPVAWAQIVDGASKLAIHQYKQDGSDGDTNAETNTAMWYNLLVTCA